MRARQAATIIGKSARLAKKPGVLRKLGKGLAIMTLISAIGTASMVHTAIQYNYGGINDTFSEIKAELSDAWNGVKQEAASNLSNYLLNANFGSDTIDEVADHVRDWAGEIAGENEQLGEFQKATVIRVVDGDTIVVSIDNENVKVRLIGVDTPESVASQEYLDKTGKQNTQEGKTASAFTKEVLSHCDAVYLQADEGDLDKYGRALRYVWIEVPSEISKEEIEEKMLQGILLSNGYAKTMSIKPNVKYAETFSEIQADYEADR